MAPSREVLEKLARFDTPTICNVIELFQVRPRNQGYMDARVRSCFPDLPPMVGFATTGAFRSDAPPAGGDAYGSLDQQLERMAQLPGPAVVVFQDLDDPPVSAVFGEVMCSSYRAFGAAGLVTNGAGRDLSQVHRLQFPVFTGSTICSHGYCHLLHLGLPVRVGGLMVREGDLLHGDENGVTNVPWDLAAEIADVTPEFIAAEEIVMNYVKADGDKRLAEYRARFAEFQARVKDLTARVARGST